MADCGQGLRVPSAMGPSKAQAHEDISPANFSIPLSMIAARHSKPKLAVAQRYL